MNETIFISPKKTRIYGCQLIDNCSDNQDDQIKILSAAINDEISLVTYSGMKFKRIY